MSHAQVEFVVTVTSSIVAVEMVMKDSGLGRSVTNNIQANVPWGQRRLYVQGHHNAVCVCVLCSHVGLSMCM